jgi:hypothetical protein
VVALLAWAAPSPAAAQTLAPASPDALDKALQILLDPQARSGELEAVDRARTDPAGFAAMLSPATQQRLRDLSVKISDAKR